MPNPHDVMAPQRPRRGPLFPAAACALALWCAPAARLCAGGVLIAYDLGQATRDAARIAPASVAPGLTASPITLGPKTQFVPGPGRFAGVREALGPRGFAVRSSLDNFAGDLLGPMPIEGTDQVTAHTVALGAAFRRLTMPVTFRIYGFAAESGAGVWALVNGPDGTPLEILGETR